VWCVYWEMNSISLLTINFGCSHDQAALALDADNMQILYMHWANMTYIHTNDILEFRRSDEA